MAAWEQALQELVRTRGTALVATGPEGRPGAAASSWTPPDARQGHRASLAPTSTPSGCGASPRRRARRRSAALEPDPGARDLPGLRLRGPGQPGTRDLDQRGPD